MKTTTRKVLEIKILFIPKTKTPFFNVNENLTETKFAELVLMAVKNTLQPHLVFLKEIESSVLILESEIEKIKKHFESG